MLRLEVRGMTCKSCEQRVREALSAVQGVQSVEVFLDTGKVLVWVSPGTPADVISHTISDVGYTVAGSSAFSSPSAPPPAEVPMHPASAPQEDGTRLRGYLPLLVVFAQIVALAAWGAHWMSTEAETPWMDAFMRFTMVGYFLFFGLFKVMNLRGFVALFRRYDVVARRAPVYAWSFPFLEWAAGWSYLVVPDLGLWNGLIALWLMVSIVGPLQVIFRKDFIRCACLGDALSQPVGWVTVAENGIMLLMALFMMKLG
jgi:copper chaperone CopZ